MKTRRSRVVPMAGIVVLAATLVAFVTANAVNPPGAPADHFLAYKSKTTRKTPKFAPVLAVPLADGFESGSFDVKAVADLLVPVAAIQTIANQSVVFVQESANRFVRRDVDLGMTAGDLVEIRSGVQAGDTVQKQRDFGRRAHAKTIWTRYYFCNSFDSLSNRSHP